MQAATTGTAAAVERPDEITAVGDETNGLGHVAGHHHAEVEAGRELALAPVDDDGSHVRVGVGGLDRRFDARDQVECQRVHLAVVDVQHGDRIAPLDSKCIRFHRPTVRRVDLSRPFGR